MPAMPPILLDHVDEDPSQRYPLATAPGVELEIQCGIPVLRNQLINDGTGYFDIGCPERPDLVRLEPARKTEFGIPVGIPIEVFPGFRRLTAPHRHPEPEILDPGKMRQEAPERQCRRRMTLTQLFRSEAAAFPFQRGSKIVNEAQCCCRLTCYKRRLGPTLFIHLLISHGVRVLGAGRWAAREIR